MCWHKWSKWAVVAKGETRECFNRFTLKPLDQKDRIVTGRFEEQRRECQKCGKSQLRHANT